MDAMQATVKSFKSAIGFDLLDPYSSNAWAKQMRVDAGVRYEALEIGIESRPTAWCRLVHVDRASHRPALLHARAGAGAQDALPWVGSLVEREVGLLSCDLGEDVPRDGPLGDCVADIWRLVSYLSLRNDLVDPRHIFCYADGHLAACALCAAAVDDRIRGLVLQTPSSWEGPSGEPPLSSAVALIAPRPLAILDCRPLPGTESAQIGELWSTFVDQAESAYQKAGRLDRLWLGKRESLDLAQVLDRMLA
jgi:hypothetical protein